MAPAADLEALSGDDFLRLYRNNVVSVYQMTRAVAAALKASGAGSVVNLVSRAGVTGGGTSTAYAATKAAVHTLTKSLARVLLLESGTAMTGEVVFMDSSVHLA